MAWHAIHITRLVRYICNYPICNHPSRVIKLTMELKGIASRVDCQRSTNCCTTKRECPEAIPASTPNNSVPLPFWPLPDTELLPCVPSEGFSFFSACLLPWTYGLQLPFRVQQAGTPNNSTFHMSVAAKPTTTRRPGTSVLCEFKNIASQMSNTLRTR